MNASTLRVVLFIALVVTTVCLIQTRGPDAEPSSELTKKLMQQAELEILLREGSHSEIQAIARSQAKADFDAGNIRFEIAGNVVKRVVLNGEEAELFFEGLPVEETLALLGKAKKLTWRDKKQMFMRFNFNSARLGKQVASVKSRDEQTSLVADTPSLKASYLADTSLAPGAIVYADAYNTRMICLTEPGMATFLSAKREDATTEKVSLLDVLLQLGSNAQIEETAKERAVIDFNSGHPHLKMAGTYMLRFYGVPEDQHDKLENLMRSFYADSEKQGMKQNQTAPLAGEFDGGLPYGCTNGLAHSGISYARAYNEKMVELILQYSRE